MANVFLDANFYIDLSKSAKDKWQSLRGNLLIISSLSTHILCYTRKLKVPNHEIDKLQEQLDIISLTKKILNKALKGPTNDLEDNIQLYSASYAKADYFLTADKKLLKMKFFGEMQIVSSLQAQENPH